MATPSSTADSDDDLGNRLRALRTRQGLSVREVARRADVTASFLSQVERNNALPSIQTLRRLSEVLGISMSEALGQSTPQVELTRVDERPQIILPSRRMQAELLVGATGWPFEILFVRLAPGMSSAPEPASHDAKEAVVVLTGRAKFESGTRVEHLLVGDSVAYDSRVPHRFTNDGDVELTFIDVIAGRF